MPGYLVPTLDDTGSVRAAHVSFDPSTATPDMDQESFDAWRGVITGASAPGARAVVQSAPVATSGDTVALRSPAARVNALANQAQAAATIKYENLAEQRKRRALDTTSALANIGREQEEQKARANGWQPGNSLSARDYNTQQRVIHAYAQKSHHYRMTPTGDFGAEIDPGQSLEDILNEMRANGQIGGFASGPPRTGGS